MTVKRIQVQATAFGRRLLSAQYSSTPGTSPGQARIEMLIENFRDLDVRTTPIPYNLDQLDYGDFFVTNLEFLSGKDLKTKTTFGPLFLSPNGLVESEYWSDGPGKLVSRVSATLVDARTFWGQYGYVTLEANVISPVGGLALSTTEWGMASPDSEDLTAFSFGQSSLPLSYERLFGLVSNSLIGRPTFVFHSSLVSEVKSTDPRIAPANIKWDFASPKKALDDLLSRLSATISMSTDFRTAYVEPLGEGPVLADFATYDKKNLREEKYTIVPTHVPRKLLYLGAPKKVDVITCFDGWTGMLAIDPETSEKVPASRVLDQYNMNFTDLGRFIMLGDAPEQKVTFLARKMGLIPSNGSGDGLTATQTATIQAKANSMDDWACRMFRIPPEALRYLPVKPRAGLGFDGEDVDTDIWASTYLMRQAATDTDDEGDEAYDTAPSYAVKNGVLVRFQNREAVVDAATGVVTFKKPIGEVWADKLFEEEQQQALEDEIARADKELKELTQELTDQIKELQEAAGQDPTNTEYALLAIDDYIAGTPGESLLGLREAQVVASGVLKRSLERMAEARKAYATGQPTTSWREFNELLNRLYRSKAELERFLQDLNRRSVQRENNQPVREIPHYDPQGPGQGYEGGEEPSSPFPTIKDEEVLARSTEDFTCAITGVNRDARVDQEKRINAEIDKRDAYLETIYNFPEERVHSQSNHLILYPPPEIRLIFGSTPRQVGPGRTSPKEWFTFAIHEGQPREGFEALLNSGQLYLFFQNGMSPYDRSAFTIAESLAGNTRALEDIRREDDSPLHVVQDANMQHRAGMSVFFSTDPSLEGAQGSTTTARSHGVAVWDNIEELQEIVNRIAKKVFDKPYTRRGNIRTVDGFIQNIRTSGMISNFSIYARAGVGATTAVEGNLTIKLDGFRSYADVLKDNQVIVDQKTIVPLVERHKLPEVLKF